MVERKNILVLPAEGTIATEVTACLRYEKSVRLILLDNDTANLDAVILLPGAPSHEGTNHIPVIDWSTGADAQADTGDTYACYTSRDGKLIYCATLAFKGGEVSLQPATAKVRAAATGLSHKPGCWTLTPEPEGGYRRLEGLDAQSLRLHRLFGANLILLSLFEAFGQPVALLPAPANTLQLARGGEIVVPQGPVFLDLDDTLLVHGAPHDGFGAFMQRADAAGVAIHLITRHFREPEITLREHGIDPGCFARIHWLTDGTPKSDMVRAHGGTAFIDDSFKERREVAMALAIPTFAADMLAALRF
ncbi:hypothetical protein [Kordiimonas gwangyangensis]|nr:hypothetical protein [Kordiimonas gwangyangensis]